MIYHNFLISSFLCPNNNMDMSTKEEMMPMKEEMIFLPPKKAMSLVVGAGPNGIAALRSLKDVGTVVCQGFGNSCVR